MSLDNYKLHIGAKIGPIYFYCKCLIIFFLLMSLLFFGNQYTTNAVDVV